jgi:hypothetical protein
VIFDVLLFVGDFVNVFVWSLLPAPGGQLLDDQ